jgi:hypothetical protein
MTDERLARAALERQIPLCSNRDFQVQDRTLPGIEWLPGFDGHAPRRVASKPSAAKRVALPSACDPIA